MNLGPGVPEPLPGNDSRIGPYKRGNPLGRLGFAAFHYELALGYGYNDLHKALEQSETLRYNTCPASSACLAPRVSCEPRLGAANQSLHAKLGVSHRLWAR